MQRRHQFLVLGIFTINIILRSIYAVYGYISSEEGMLIYGQKLAYMGLLPFVDYNAWNSLLNNYLVGWYQFIVPQTIITQRIFAIFTASAIFYLAIYTCRALKKETSSLLAAFLLTFGSFTYLYYSSVPTSEQIMILSLMISVALIAKSLNTKKNNLLLYICSFLFAILAFPIRPQALPAIILLWLFIAWQCRKNLSKVGLITISGLCLLLLIYLPFMLSGWDNFIYSFTWPFKAHEILVYQVGFKDFNPRLLVPFFINVSKEYMIILGIMGSILFGKLYTSKKLASEVASNPQQQFILLIFLMGASMASLSLLHKPPYSTYIYPAVPFFALSGALYITDLLESIKGYRYAQIRGMLYGFLITITFIYLMIFPHNDYMKTSFATITNPPYILLKNIHAYIETITGPGSEVLSFYLPAVAELDRVVPKDLNEGEGSMSILTTEQAKKYNLTNVQMLKDYISSEKAEAIVMVSITPRFFGTTEEEKLAVLETLNKHYILEKTFSEFEMIGNPKVSELYVYLLRK